MGSSELNIAKGTLDPDFQKVSTHMKCSHLIFQAKKFMVLVDNLQKDDVNDNANQ